MKKRIFYAVGIAVLATAGFTTAEMESHTELSPSQLENLDALTDKEWWIESEYAQCCLASGDDYCLLSSSAAIPNSTPVPCK